MSEVWQTQQLQRQGNRAAGSQEAELQALVQPLDCLGEKQVLRNLKSAVGRISLLLVRRCQQSDLSLLLIVHESVFSLHPGDTSQAFEAHTCSMLSLWCWDLSP